jgi:predicted GTPase
VIINKIDTANFENVLKVRSNVQALNPKAIILEAASPLLVDDPQEINGKRVLVVEDGPTLTHGEMSYGAGVIAARRFGAKEIVDPRPFAVGSIRETYAKYPKTGTVLPAMGYGAQQIADLEATLNNADADLVIVATPMDLRRVLKVKHPMQRVRYTLQVIGTPTLEELLAAKLALKEPALK